MKRNVRFRISDDSGIAALWMVYLVLMFLSTLGWFFSRSVTNEMQMSYRTADVIRTQLLASGMMTACGMAPLTGHGSTDGRTLALNDANGLITLLEDNSENTGKIDYSVTLNAANFAQIVDVDDHAMVSIKRIDWEGTVTGVASSANPIVINAKIAKDYKILDFHVPAADFVFGWHPSAAASGTDMMNNCPENLIINGESPSGGDKGAVHLAGSGLVFDMHSPEIMGLNEFNDAQSDSRDLNLIPGLNETGNADWKPQHGTATAGDMTAQSLYDAYQPDVDEPLQNCADAESGDPVVDDQQTAVEERIWFSGLTSGATHLWGMKAETPVDIYATNLQRKYKKYTLEVMSGTCGEDTCEAEDIWCTEDKWKINTEEIVTGFLDESDAPSGWSIEADGAQVRAPDSTAIGIYDQSEYKLAATTFYENSKYYTEVLMPDGSYQPDSIYDWGGLLYTKADVVVDVSGNCTGKLRYHSFLYAEGDVKINRSVYSEDDADANNPSSSKNQLVIIAEGQLKTLSEQDWNSVSTTSSDLSRTFLYLKSGLGTDCKQLNLSGNLILGENSNVNTDRDKLGGEITYMKPIGMHRHTVPHSNCGFYYF